MASGSIESKSIAWLQTECKKAGIDTSDFRRRGRKKEYIDALMHDVKDWIKNTVALPQYRWITNLESIRLFTEENYKNKLCIKEFRDIKKFQKNIETLKSKAFAVDELRDASAIKKFRKAKGNVKNMHCAHRFPLFIAKKLNAYVKTPSKKLRKLCNNEKNLCIVEPCVNQSDHAKIDNTLWRSFEKIHILNNKQYTHLLETNPCKLVKKLKKDKCTKLDLKEYKRAKEQVEVLQNLSISFPDDYKAVARVFYHCFVDKIQGTFVWEDRNDSKSFKKYCRDKQLDESHTAKSTKSTEKPNDDDAKSETLTLRKKKQRKPLLSSSGCYLIKSDGGNMLYKAADDGIYYEASGNDEYMKKGKHRLYQGPRGGIYYKYSSGKPKYLSKKEKKSMFHDLINEEN